MSLRMYPCMYPAILSPSHAILVKASYWPSDHMISLRPLIGQPPLGWGGGLTVT